METIRFEAVVKKIMADGPSRVILNAEGEAVSFRRAQETNWITPDVIFIREDGWSLGAPGWLESVAYKMWADEWIGFIRRDKNTALPMTAYGGGR